MAKQNIFVPKVKNHVSRNAFDLSQRRIFSSKCGEILPCFLQDCLPGDKYRVKASTFSRTAPLNTAAFARMKQYFNFYFVPYRLLYRDFPSFVVQQSKSSKAATDISTDVVVPSSLPFVTESDLQHVARSTYAGDGNTAPCPVKSDLIGHFFTPVGTSRMLATRKLLQYLGYYKTTRSVISDDTWEHNNSRLSLFPLLAYQKVYNDFYRFSQWENEQANTYNVDYMAGKSSMAIPISSLFVTNDKKGWYPASHKPNMFDMRYVNFTKDTFLGVVPSSQFGAVSSVQSADLSHLYIQSLGDTKGLQAGFDPTYNDLGVLKSAGDGPSSTIERTQVRLADLSNSSVQSFDILSLRAAQAKQKFLEVTLSNNSDYKSQIEAHFNVNVSSLQSGLCDYIGGFSSDFSINTVTNTNLAADGSTANYAANGIVQGNGDFEFEAREHGLIIGVMYTLPFIDYSVLGYDASCLRTQFSDFALPEYDRLGFESVDPRLLTGDLYHTPPYDMAGNNRPIKNLGFGPRYYDYKTNYDIVLGDFNKSQNGTQPNFVCSLSQDSMLHDFFNTLVADSSVGEGQAVVFLDHLEKSDISFGLLGDLDFFNAPKYSSFKVYPSILNNIFSVYSSIVKGSDGQYIFKDGVSFDQFYNVVDFNTQVIRNLDRLGLPY